MIHHVSVLRIGMDAAERGLDARVAERSLRSGPGMQTRTRLYKLPDEDSYNVLDTSVFKSDVPTAR